MIQRTRTAFSIAGMLTVLALSIAEGSTILIVDGLDDTTDWTIVSTGDAINQFGYDYSADGIPPAPNGADTIGLKMQANVFSPAGVEEIAALRSLSDAGYISGSPYRVSVDVWVNYGVGSSGSTEFAGAFVGHQTVFNPRDGAGLLYDGDGDSSRDYRLYKNTGEQFIASAQYNPAFVSNNNSDPVISAAFPSVDISAATSGQQVGSTPAGAGGFQWMTLEIDVDPNAIGQGTTSDPGLATFTLTSEASGSSLLIGTIDNSNGGTVVPMEGDIALVYADLFSGVATAPNFAFGVFDNLVVKMVPEPSSLLMVFFGFGLFALVRGKRR